MKDINSIRFEEIPYEYSLLWKSHSIAIANREMMEESKKSVLAKLMSQVIIPEWLKDSESYRERIARQSKEYKDFLKNWQTSIQQEAEKKHSLNSLNMLFEYYRSTNSLEKAKTKIL